MISIDEGLGILYRCEYIIYRDSVELYYNMYPITKKTPKGCWIRVYGIGLNKDQKFINLECRKQWASISKQEALKCFYHRKARQIKIMESRLINVKDAFNLAKRELGVIKA